MLAKETAGANVKDSRFVRYAAFCTVWFVAVALVVCVLGTGVWVLHNRNIFRRRGQRTGVREATLDYSRDPLGRTVSYEMSERALHSAPVVRVLIEPDRKLYRPVQSGKNGGSAA